MTQENQEERELSEVSKQEIIRQNVNFYRNQFAQTIKSKGFPIAQAFKEAFDSLRGDTRILQRQPQQENPKHNPETTTCSKCGSIISKNMDFCPSCGTPQSREAILKKQQEDKLESQRKFGVTTI